MLIDFFKGKESRETRILRELETRQEPYSVPVFCAQEVLQGARSEQDFRKLWAFFKTQDLVTTKDGREFHYRAAKLFFDCRRIGKTVGSVDCMIAQLALDNAVHLLASDSGFGEIARVRKELRLV